MVADAVLAAGNYELAGFADDLIPVGSQIYLSYSVLCKSSDPDIAKYADEFIVAIGDNNIRRILFDKLKTSLKPVAIIHPFSYIAKDVKIGKGTMILAGVVINPDVIIGENVIINSGSLVDHDSIIDDHVHIGQKAIIGSGNKIETMKVIQQGENVRSVFH